MKYFDINNPPKKLRFSELALPEKPGFHIDLPVDGLKCLRISNFNKFSPGQLAEYQQDMIKKWGDLVLTLCNSSDYYAYYKPVYKSRFKNWIRRDEMLTAQALDNFGTTC